MVAGSLGGQATQSSVNGAIMPSTSSALRADTHASRVRLIANVSELESGSAIIIVRLLLQLVATLFLVEHLHLGHGFAFGAHALDGERHRLAIGRNHARRGVDDLAVLLFD